VTNICIAKLQDRQAWLARQIKVLETPSVKTSDAANAARQEISVVRMRKGSDAGAPSFGLLAVYCRSPSLNAEAAAHLMRPKRSVHGIHRREPAPNAAHRLVLAMLLPTSSPLTVAATPDHRLTGSPERVRAAPPGFVFSLEKTPPAVRAMQRSFSMLPAGSPGDALLILRAASGAMLLHDLVGSVTNGVRRGPFCCAGTSDYLHPPKAQAKIKPEAQRKTRE
jgi:hypothetical protein